jgi:hypothetical protein
MTLADKLLVLFAILVAASSYYLAWQPSTAGSYVKIYQPNTLYKQQSLNDTTRLHVPGKLGDSVLEIDQGRVRFQSSPCTGKFCVHAGWLQQAGEVMACLPNGIHIEIHGGESHFDALAF